MIDKDMYRQMKIALLITAMCTILIMILPPGSASTLDEYITEKVTIANDSDWGKYSEITGTYFVIVDTEPYTFYIENSTIEFNSSVPITYDYKIITTTSNVDKWWEIAEYYLENGKITFKQKYIDIPWLYLNTPVQEYGSTGNIAYAAQTLHKTTINII